MSDWKERIEAQIAWLRSESVRISRLIGERSNDGTYAHSFRRRKEFLPRVQQLNQAADSLQDLLDVAVAADADSENMGRWLENLFMELDKLREASNE